MKTHHKVFADINRHISDKNLHEAALCYFREMNRLEQERRNKEPKP
jgi:hypothetical protein